MQPKRTSGRRRYSLSLLAISSLSLAACVETGTANRACVPQVYPSDEALDWFERANPPVPVVDYLDRLEKQQRAIEVACGAVKARSLPFTGGWKGAF